MNYSIRIKGSAARELRRIAGPDRTRIVTAIDRLAETPHLGAPLKGDLRGLRRLRVGDYRVVYEIRDDELVVLVVRVAHRRNVYRRAGSWHWLRTPPRAIVWDVLAKKFSSGQAGP